MSQRIFTTICALIFLFMALAHLSRVFTGWEIVIAGWVVPQKASIVGLVVTGLMSAWGFNLVSHSGTRRKYRM
jgi:hypothetical protein